MVNSQQQRLLRGTGLGVFLSIVLMSCGDKQPEARREQFTIKKVDLRDVMSQTGEVRPVVKVEVKSEASGKIERVLVKEGQQVKKGDTLVVIDPLKLRNRKERVDLAVKKARLQMDKAQRELDRRRALQSTGTVPASQLEDLEDAFALAEINYRQQVLELKDIVDELSRTVVLAPMNGVVTALNVEEGEIAVSATSGFQSGTSIATVADVSRLEVVSQIGEADYVKLEKGQSVIIRPQAFENTKTHGTISFIAMSAKRSGNEGLGSFEVRIAVDTVIPGIAPGVNVNVDFVLMETEGVLGVPYHFVEKRGKRHTVMVEGDEGKIEPRPIEVGLTDYRHYEIRSGLQEGDKVVHVARSPGQGRPPRRGGH